MTTESNDHNSSMKAIRYRPKARKGKTCNNWNYEKQFLNLIWGEKKKKKNEALTEWQIWKMAN